MEVKSSMHAFSRRLFQLNRDCWRSPNLELNRFPSCAQYVFLVTHWSACAFYFIALMHHLGADTWIGRHFDDVLDLPLASR